MPAYLVEKDGTKRPLVVVANAVLQQPATNNIQWKICETHGKAIVECGCWQKSARDYVKKKSGRRSNHSNAR